MILHHFMNFWRYHSLCIHEQWWRPLHTLLELLLNIKGPRYLNYIQSQSYSYALWCGIWESFRLLTVFEVTVQGCCNVIKNDEKTHFYSEFWTSSHWNVTARKTIGDMYFMYVDMAWLQSLSRLEHDMLHSTVWPVHKICPMLMCWRPNPTYTKIMLFLPILPGMLSL